MPEIVAICTVKAEEFVLQEMHNPCYDLHFALINVLLKDNDVIEKFCYVLRIVTFAYTSRVR